MPPVPLLAAGKPSRWNSAKRGMDMAGKTPNGPVLRHRLPRHVQQDCGHKPNNNPAWWVGMVACILVAVAAQAHAMPEPWSHIVSTAGTVGAALNGFLIRRE